VRRSQGAKREDSLESVFVNVPYDSAFERLFLAYIAAISAFGFVPRATLEIPPTRARLDRILQLIKACDYSVHDISRVQLDSTPPRTPRFNMPFELGLAIGFEHAAKAGHAWAVCESQPHRAHKSLSDLNGIEIYVHDNTVRGVFRELCSMFVRGRRQPTVTEMWQIYRILRREFDETLRRAGASSPYNARVFRDLCVLASAAADELVG
jgi:hypothetical protein